MILKLKEWNDVVIVKLGQSGSTRTAQEEENGLNIWWCVDWQSLTVTAACLDNVSIYWKGWNCPDFESVPIPIHCHQRILCPIFPILSTMPYFLLPCCVMWMLFIDFAIILFSDIFRYWQDGMCITYWRGEYWHSEGENISKTFFSPVLDKQSIPMIFRHFMENPLYKCHII